MKRDQKVDRESIRRFYRLLRHAGRGLTEVRVIQAGQGQPRIGFYDSEDAFVDACSRWSGKANVYVGRNPRPKRLTERQPQAYNNLVSGVRGASASDIDLVTALSLDIDPVRANGLPSTDAEHERALAMAERVAADYPGAILVDSGNGAQVVFPTDPVSVNGESKRLQAQVRAWESEIREVVESDPALKLDSIYDLPRIIKVPGTLAIKGTSTQERPHRLARIVNAEDDALCDMTDVFSRQIAADGSVTAEELGTVPEIPDRFRRLQQADRRIRATWEGSRDDLRDASGSGYDMSMISQLQSRGFSPGEIAAVLLEMPSGTQDERRIRRSIQKALEKGAAQKPGGGNSKSDSPIIAADAADDFLRERDLEGKLRRWRGEWWLWNGRCYERLSEEECRAQLVAYLREKDAYRARATQSFSRNVLINLASLGALPDGTDLPFWIRESGVEREPSLVILENGMVNIEKLVGGQTESIQPHSPEFFSPTLLPYEFNPHATCPRWRQFLSEILPDADARRFLQEWFGYNLVYDLSQQRFLILEGEGANGKSVVCQVLRSLVGEANVTAVPLELFGARFQLGPTLGMLANIVPEMGEMDKVAEGSLKPFVSGDAMQFDRKNKEPITAVPTARLTFATNTRPRFSDRSEGVWRRLLMLPFTVQIPPERQDRWLGEKLQQELPGIFIWAVQGLQRLRERGHFLEPTVSHTAKEEYRREVNPARVFLEEQCEADPRATVEKDHLYRTYKIWAEAQGYRPLGNAQFSKEVRRVYPVVRPSRPRQGEERKNTFEGIELRAG